MRTKQILAKLCAMAAMALTVMLLASCRAPEQNAEALPAAAASPEAETPADAETEPGASETAEFQLSEAERALFDAYAENYDIAVFKDVPPVSIAKVFIHCGIIGDTKGEFMLFAEEGRAVSLEAYEAQNAETEETAPLPLDERQWAANILFGNLDGGVFTEGENGRGTIAFDSEDGQKLQFKLIQNADGIWLINYNMLEATES